MSESDQEIIKNAGEKSDKKQSGFHLCRRIKKLQKKWFW
jgi:hypothetical protein